MNTKNSTPLLLPVLLLLSAFPAPAHANLLTNGDFESATTGWTHDASFRTVPDKKRNGKVGSIENRRATETAAAFQTITIEPGKVYTLRGFTRSTKLRESAGVAIHALARDGAILQRRWVHQIPAWGLSGWTEFSARYTPPQEAAQLSIRLSIYKQGTAWFDDLELTAENRTRKENPWGKKVPDLGIDIHRIPTPVPAYTLDVHDLDNDGIEELIIGDVKGNLRVQTTDGNVLWQKELNGIALDIDCGDLDGDGAANSHAEIALCTADARGQLRVFDSSGNPRWSYTANSGKPLRRVTLAGVNPDDNKCSLLITQDNELTALDAAGAVLWTQSFGGPRMRATAVGDVTGDGQPDVLASLDAQRIFAAAFSAQGRPAWRYQPVGETAVPGDDIVSADLDGDGIAEVVMASEQGRVVCIEAGGKTRWLAERARQKLQPHHPDATGNLGGSSANICVADFIPERPGLETLVSLIADAWLLDRDGKFIWETASGPLLLDLVQGSNGAIYAPSSGFRDASVYRLNLVRGKGNPLSDYRIDNPIHSRLDRLHAGLKTQKPHPAPSHTDADGKFHVICADLPSPLKPYGSYDELRAAHATFTRLESPHLEFVFMLWPKDLPVELHRGQMSEPEKILDVVRFLEDLGRPFLFFVDHGCAPNLSLATIKKTLELAPNTCRGFYAAENTIKYPSKKWDEFADWAVQVMDLCVRHGNRKMIFKEMYDAWAMIPADPRVRETILHPKYRDIFIPVYATNNPHAPELQFGGMIGLEHAGYAREWGVSTQHWNWSWSAHGLTEYYPNICPADVIMRMELVSACLGGRWFHIEGGQEYLERADQQLSSRARRHRDLVYELIRKNLLLPIPRTDNLSFSSLVVARQPHPAIDQSRAGNLDIGGVHHRPAGPLRTGFLGVGDAMQTTPAGYLPRLAYYASRYNSTMFPPTPFGWLRIVPDCERSQPFLDRSQVIHTDGHRVIHKDNAPLDAANAIPFITESLKTGARDIPFIAEDASLSIHRLEKNRYRLWLLDPGYMNPAGVTTTIRLRNPSSTQILSATDPLTGKSLPLPATGNQIPIEIPPGAFRVLDVVTAVTD